MDLFPIEPQVDVLDPQQVVGARTAVESVVRVRLRRSEPPHLVFHDRHGWYCEAHGATCGSVALARTVAAGTHTARSCRRRRL
jgi:hypothetical protein